MSKQLLVITGVSGHVGFRVLVEALNRAYKARAVIRNAAQAEKVKASESVKPNSAQLEFALVPDLLVVGAFQGVLDGADGVVHVCISTSVRGKLISSVGSPPSPMALLIRDPSLSQSENFKRDLIEPAVNATLGILKAAREIPTIKKVVITSSIASLITWDYLTSSDFKKVFTVRDTYTPASLDDPFANAMDAYGTSKAAALAATESFMEKERLHFEVVTIMPSMVTGRNELNRKPEDVGKGSNGNTLGILLNKKSDLPGLGASIHVNDVARAHIDALNPALRGNRNYLCFSGGVEGTTWNDAKDIVRRHFPKANICGFGRF